ncbi:MAG: hypothetical protein IJ251_07260 [Oscillospiraceae bacterium]|nr:hypothetical protein [Oscillospiraceae bacterium]
MISINKKQRTEWEGLWYHPEYHSYSSVVINLSLLRKFKGNVRIIARKNRYHISGENTPNMQFMICDTDYPAAKYPELFEDEEPEISDDYIKSIPSETRPGERKWYTEEEVYECIRGAVEDANRGCTDPYDHLIGDFVDARCNKEQAKE